MARHRKMLAPINAVKHYVHRPSVGVVSASILNHVLVNSVVAPATATAADVKEGAIIKAIFIELWCIGLGAADTTAQFNVAIEKLQGGQPLMTFAQSINLGAYPNKKNVLYTTQGLLTSNVADAQSVNIARSWMLIPKGKQRFGLGDRLLINISSTGQRIDWCGITTYKEYT